MLLLWDQGPPMVQKEEAKSGHLQGSQRSTVRRDRHSRLYQNKSNLALHDITLDTEKSDLASRLLQALSFGRQ